MGGILGAGVWRGNRARIFALQLELNRREYKQKTVESRVLQDSKFYILNSMNLM